MFEREARDNPGIEEQVVAAEPIGRMAEPAEVGEAVVWLCSDAASFVDWFTHGCRWRLGGTVAQNSRSDSPLWMKKIYTAVASVTENRTQRWAYYSRRVRYSTRNVPGKEAHMSKKRVLHHSMFEYLRGQAERHHNRSLEAGKELL